MSKDDTIIDQLDISILSELQKDARVSFQDLARQMAVSGGTIHVRYNKLRETGVVKGVRLMLDSQKLGYQISSFIGLNLKNAGDYKTVLSKLKEFPEVIEAHYTTGPYSLFIKILVKNTQDLHRFLIEELQAIPEIQSTETLISLDTPIDRPASLKELEENS